MEDAEEEERRLHREAERARLGTFLFGCGSKLSQGVLILLSGGYIMCASYYAMLAGTVHIGAYVVVLRELCAVLASYLMEHLLLRARFSEWGALLLYQEVRGIVRYLLVNYALIYSVIYWVIGVVRWLWCGADVRVGDSAGPVHGGPGRPPGSSAHPDREGHLRVAEPGAKDTYSGRARRH